MSAFDTASLFCSCAGLLALAVLGLLAGSSPLAPRLVLLCLDLFAWEAASLAHQLSGHEEWQLLNVALSPLAPPLALDFVLAFAGSLRQRRALRRLAWGGFGLLSAACALAFVWAPARGFAGSRAWAALYLAGLLPALGAIALVLEAHRREASDAEERRRTQLVLFGFALGIITGATNLVNDLWPAVPSLGALGLLAAAAVTALAALRFRLFDRRLPLLAGAAALALGASGALLHLQGFTLLAPPVGAMALGAASLALAVLAVSRSAAAEATQASARRSLLSFHGRVAAQLAHDLANPLAALKGAALSLEAEEAQPGAGRARRSARPLLEQIARLEQIVDRHQRFSRGEARRSAFELNELVRGVLSLQPFAAARVEIQPALDPGLPPCWGDRELLASALESLLQNAFEAMPEGGTAVVRTAAREGALLLSVEDDGPGMDPRARERAFDEFFTTKPGHDGLGLSFVRRVAEAHGGGARVRSAWPRGTVVEVELPQ